MDYSLDRRKFLLGGAALAAVGSAVSNLAYAQEQRLRMVWWGGQDRLRRTLKVAELFMEKNPGTKIAGEFISWNDYWTRLATQVAAGNAPDLIQMDLRFVPEFATKNTISPLDDYVGTTLDLANIDQNVQKSFVVNNKVYGVHVATIADALIVNSAAFKEAGVALPDRDTTYSDITKMGLAFKAARIRGGMRVIADGSGYEPMLENFLRQRGKAMYTPTGEIAFDAKDATDWFQMWSEFRDAGVCVSAETEALDTGSLESTMLTAGKAALQPATSNQLLSFQAINKDPLAISNYPRVAPAAAGGHYRKPSTAWCITSTSRNKSAAAAFISYFINDLGAAEVLGVERGVPASSIAREHIAPGLNEQSKMVVSYLSNLGDLAGQMPPRPPVGAGEIERSLLRTISQEVAFRTRTPAEGGKLLVEQGARILARAKQ